MAIVVMEVHKTETQVGVVARPVVARQHSLRPAHHFMIADAQAQACAKVCFGNTSAKNLTKTT